MFHMKHCPDFCLKKEKSGLFLSRYESTNQKEKRPRNRMKEKKKERKGNNP